MTPVLKGERKQIVLPGWVFDGLALSAEAFGGIGAGDYTTKDGDEYIPLCALGHVGRCSAANVPDLTTTLLRAFRANQEPAVWGVMVNDNAVDRINRRKGAAVGTRVTFAEWCAELNVVADYMVTP